MYDYEHCGRVADINFYKEIAQQQKGKILDIGCGTGRISIPLAIEGFSITCIDKASVMLDHFKQKLRSQPKVSRNIEIINADMINFNIFKKDFDLIICSYNTFYNLHKEEDQLEFLDNIKKYLSPGGKFVIDISAPNHGNLAPSKRWVFEKENLLNNGFYSERYYRHISYDKSEQIIKIQFETKLYDNNKVIVNSWYHNYVTKYCTLNQMLRIIRKSNLKEEIVYGDYSFHEYKEVANPEVQLFIIRQL
jgi:2-polyprenyl-3-methyl-5-hydroxy-6-metoxy-1,4-benzoquinol methylase